MRSNWPEGECGFPGLFSPVRLERDSKTDELCILNPKIRYRPTVPDPRTGPLSRHPSRADARPRCRRMPTGPEPCRRLPLPASPRRHPFRLPWLLQILRLPALPVIPGAGSVCRLRPAIFPRRCRRPPSVPDRIRRMSLRNARMSFPSSLPSLPRFRHPVLRHSRRRQPVPLR